MASTCRRPVAGVSGQQRLWIKYRDANCAFAGSATGGTIDQVNGSGCVLDMTQTRAQELEDLVGP